MNQVFIEDKNGNKVLPITSFSSVRDTNGNNLNQVLLTKVNNSEKGQSGGVATLDNNGKIPSSQIPTDSTPTNNSDNPITSSAVYEALEGKQATIDNNHKLDADLVDDTNSTNKFTNSTEKGTWNGKQNKINVSGLLKGDGEGGVSAAISGTDYVAPETGKGLSTNDYDDASKNKVNNIPNSPIYTDTTYSLDVGTDQDANKIILTSSTGEPDKITVPYATTAGSAPANGGNATTVNNHSVNTDVPANAVFTDTHHDGSVTADDGYVLTKVEVSSAGIWSKEQVAIPDELSDLQDDSSHRTVTDTEKTSWNGKQAKITANGILKGDGNGGISAVLKQDIVDLGIPSTDTNTTYKLKIGSTTNGDSVNGVDLGTLENKSAASGGTDLSLVTTGEKYTWNNKASLDENGKVPSSQLPSYVDDVIDLLNITDTAPSTFEEGDMYYNSTSAKIYTATGTNTWGSTGETPEHSKIYVNLYNNKSYRWSGTAMVEIASCDIQGAKVGPSGTPITPSQGYIILPPYESGAQVNTITGVKGSSETNYRVGDVNITPANIGLGNVGNFKAVSTAANQGLTNTEKSNAKANIGLNNVENTADEYKNVWSARTLKPIADIEDYGAGMSVDELKHLIFYNEDIFSGSPNGSYVVVFDDFIYNFEDDSYTVQGGSGEPAIITFIGGDTVMYPLWLVTISATNDDNIGVIERRDEGLILRWLAHTNDIPHVPSWALQSSKPTYTPSEVGLGNVGNFKAVSTESNQHLSSTEKLIARTNIGLGNVEDKSSSAIRGELTSANVTSALGYTPINPNEKGANSGVATLGDDGKVPSNQLPSYVDDVLEYATKSAFPATGESGKIYVDLSTDRTYRWSGTQYTPIKGDLAIGSTTGTAADGGIVNTHITDSTIHVTSTEKQTWNNKQKAIAEGRGITITPGANADTVSLNLPIYAGSGDYSITEGQSTEASGNYSHAEGGSTTASGISSHAEGQSTTASGISSHAEGNLTTASGISSHAEGNLTTAGGKFSHAEGYSTTTSNNYEHASGQYNKSNKASTTFGDSGNTLFSVGNGTANNTKHNAFEIRQNGDIYITIGGQDVKLQDNLGNKVDKTTTVNGHALSGNVAVTKSDVGLGNVVNTGDSDTPVSGGTTKFTTGGAYTELAKKADIDNDGHVPAEQLENDYPDLTAGNIVGEFTQQAEFAYRPSAGTVDVKSGYKVDHGGKVMGVKGNTVAWNQLIREEFVDMGLPSGKLWAKKNLDVTQPSGFAASEYQYECSFFSWGNTDGHNPNAQGAFDYDFGSSNDGPYASTPGSALTSDIGVANDAARFNGGAPWRMPTSSEFAELFANCDFIDANGDVISGENKLVTINSITGIRLKSKNNGNILFFPCSGHGFGSSWNDRGGGGYYWASSLYSQTTGRSLDFHSGGVLPQYYNGRFYGFTARPILTPNLNTDGDGHKYYTSPTTGTAYDLTLIYGAGNEPETTAEFEEDYFKWFGKPLSYEAYDEGSLRSVKMTGLKTVGFNAYNPQNRVDGKYIDYRDGVEVPDNDYSSTGYVHVLPNKEYYFLQGQSDNQWGAFYDSDKRFITGTVFNGLFTTPANAAFVRISFLKGDDICINLSHSGAKNGEYEEHWESQMSLAVTSLTGKLLSDGETTGNSVTVFPDGLKSVGSVRDEIKVEGNIVKAIKRVGSVDMGSLSWGTGWYNQNLNYRLYVELTGKAIGLNNLACGKYANAHEVDSSMPDFTITGNSGAIYIYLRDSNYASQGASALIASLSGVMLYYELAKPQEYILDDFDLPVLYDVDDLGTEEVTVPAGVASVAPVLDLKYGLNAADTLKNLPNSYVSVNAQTLTSDQQERVKRNLGLTNPSSIGIDSEVQTITTNTSVTIPTGNWASKTIVFVNGGSSALTVTVPTSGVQTPDGQAIELTCPVGGYCEVSLLKIGSTIYARSI